MTLSRGMSPFSFPLFSEVRGTGERRPCPEIGPSCHHESLRREGVGSLGRSVSGFRDLPCFLRTDRRMDTQGTLVRFLGGRRVVKGVPNL